jgi:2-keto-4-pentenoate hydratase/2-oxohepta-3-ene-1,7-dioic acid hydratase in catechol pathway
MRLATARENGRSFPALETEVGLEPLGVPDGTGMRELIAAGRDAVAGAVEARGEPVAGAAHVAPLTPGKIVCIGLNYLDHIRESQAERPRVPLIFAKFPTAVIGPGDPIPVDSELTERVDWEVELAAVVGRRLRNVRADEALDGVFGYTVANDVSARDLQFSDGQWVRAKSLDGFCPLGPVVVTPDELGDPQRLALRTVVNGETMQDSSTAEMLFGVAELLEFCSRSFTLEPGDLVLTGTPWGCGEFMEPRRSLNPGDEVTVEVEGIGSLRNPVVDARGR